MITWKQLAEMPIFAEFSHLTARLFDLDLAISGPHRTDKSYMTRVTRTCEISPICGAILSRPDAQRLCIADSAAHASLAARQRRTIRYVCHMGLREYIIPIMVDDELVAFLLTGQFLDHAPSAAGWRLVLHRLQELGLVPSRRAAGQLRKAYLRMKVIPPESQKDLVSLLEIFATHTAVTHARIMGLQQDPQERVATKAMRFIRQRFPGDIDIDDVADAAGASRRTIVRIMRKRTGQSVMDHVRRLRIDHACRQLHRTDDKIVDVAMKCGFISVPTFNRVFRKLKGVTPRQWRKQARRRHRKTARPGI